MFRLENVHLRCVCKYICPKLRCAFKTELDKHAAGARAGAAAAKGGDGNGGNSEDNKSVVDDVVDYDSADGDGDGDGDD